jgi:hypothetical protein
MNTSKYSTTAETAAHFSVSNATIMAMMKTGEIPVGTYARFGRVFRYDIEKIEAHLLTVGVKEGDPAEPSSSDDGSSLQRELDLSNYDLDETSNAKGEPA